MLDENLPTFYITPNGKQLTTTILFTQHGDEPQPSYTLRRPDPAQAASKNRYAVALYDAYVPDVLYGEVLIVPQWTQPTLSAEAVRQNNGVPPAPEPILPSEFAIHLYNPDQTVQVRYRPKTWNTQPSWEFEMPQQTFKQPSNSTLDRTIQSDPAVSDLTPKLKFVWRKDGSLSKDFACYLSGKSTTTPGAKKKSKEPDIAVAIFKQLKEFTLYEPNLYRVEMEDFKGLEVVLMLGAVVIRDVFFGAVKDVFNVHLPAVATSTAARSTTPPRADQARPSRPQVTIPQRNGRPVTTAPNQQASSYNTKQPQQSSRDRERERQRQEEERRTRKFLEAERQKAQRQREAEINRETERLKRLYGKEDMQSRQSNQSARRGPAPSIAVSSSSPSPNHASAHYARYSHYHSSPQHRPVPNQHLQTPGKHRPAQSFSSSSSSLYPPAQPPRPLSSASFFKAGQKAQVPAAAAPQLKEKKSFFGFRKSSSPSDDPNKLSKKRSSMF